MLYALARSKDDHASALMEEKWIREMAYLDSLIGVPSRPGLEESLHRYASLALRHDLPLSVVCFGIDDFKRINDVHGHQPRDRIWRRSGAAFGRCCGPVTCWAAGAARRFWSWRTMPTISRR